jgi:nitroreductase
MKKLLFLFLFAAISSTIFAQSDIIELPQPEKDGGMPLMQTLDKRQSSREFTDKEMPKQTLSNLLWAAYGINRPEAGKHTVPSSRNVQDISVYVTTKDGAFLYLPEENALKQIVDKDIRKHTGKQEFTADAAVNLIYVSDFSKYEGDNEQVKKVTASAHCGFIGQNVYLFAASEGLSSVFRAWIDNELIHEKLGLSENLHVLYCQSVGYPE